MAGVVGLAVVLALLPGVTRATAASPGGLQTSGAAATCSGSDARQLVESFLDSFNRGDAQQLERLVAGPEHFVWYSTDSPGQRSNDEAYNRGTLMSYFAKRHDQHERLELRSFQFNGSSPTGLGNFEFELTRSADDGLASTPYGGKGALGCDRVPRTLVVWSMAREPLLRSNLPTYLFLIAILLVTLAAAGFAFYRWRRRPLASALESAAR